MGQGPPSKPVRQRQKLHRVEETPPLSSAKGPCQAWGGARTPSPLRANPVQREGSWPPPPHSKPVLASQGHSAPPPKWQESLPMGKGSPDPCNHFRSPKVHKHSSWTPDPFALLQGGFCGHSPPPQSLRDILGFSPKPHPQSKRWQECWAGMGRVV